MLQFAPMVAFLPGQAVATGGGVLPGTTLAFFGCIRVLLPTTVISTTVGTEGANLSHFWRFNNLVKFRNIEKCSQIPKYPALGHTLVKLH